MEERNNQHRRDNYRDNRRGDQRRENYSQRPRTNPSSDPAAVAKEHGVLQELELSKLQEIAEKFKIERFQDLDKEELIKKIHEAKSLIKELKFEGVLDVMPDGYGFVRVHNYFPSENDIYVSQTQIKKHKLRIGDRIVGFASAAKEGERYDSLFQIEMLNYKPVETVTSRPRFIDLVPIYPNEMINMETDSLELTGRLVDIISPVGKGQRGMIVSPPKAGKTTFLKHIAKAIERNHPNVYIKVLLVDERPEEVTDMQRSIKGEVISSTFDEPPDKHVKVAELVLESCKRLVECGNDVVILLDSITRLARAYNLVVAPSGRTLSGGLDPISLHKPKRFFGGARNIENGGSLTILATALVETGSRMDDVIYEEFKGTGNMEVHLSRNLSNRRIFPAIDVLASGTRKEELLLSESNLKKVYLLRKNIDNEDAIDELINLLKHSKNNEEFLNSSIFG